MDTRKRLPAAVVLVLLAGTLGRAQSSAESTGYVAFRMDDSRVVAVIGEVNDRSEELTHRGVSARPVAQFGFQYFEARAAVRARVPETLRSAAWVVHGGAGRTFDATVENVVAGDPGGEELAAVLLVIAPSQMARFRSLSTRYFAATPRMPGPDGGAARSTVRTLPAPVLTAGQRQSLEAALDAVMRREWPAVRDDTARSIARAAASPRRDDRSWAAAQRRAEAALASGRTRLTYDIQAFQLDPSGVPSYFVRAEWLNGYRQAFVATVWMRADRFEVVQTDVRPASWLRIPLFEGHISRENFGLVLNVVDSDGDGWGEIVFAQSGYESRSIGMREYSADGFHPFGTSFDAGG